MGAFLEFRGFGLAHANAGRPNYLLRGVDLELPRGRLYVMSGASGSGKSSLLRVLAGLVDPREIPPRIEGSLRCLGLPLERGFPRTLRGRIVAILQDEGLLDDLTPRENVELALRAARRSIKLAPGLLARVGLDQAPGKVALLSGGMRKRLAVARALASEPEVLLCDEPTAGLDGEAARRVAELLADARAGALERTVLVISHDPGIFAGLDPDLLVLDAAARTLRRATDPPLAFPHAQRNERNDEPAEDHAALAWARELLLGVASLVQTLWESVVRLPPSELRQVMLTVARFVVEPAFFIAAAGAVIGGLATFFALRNNPLHGGFETGVLTGTGKVLTSVLVPLLSGFFFTARVVAGASARLGTMKRNHQASALRLIGVRPADYLLTPMVWGMVVAMPVVTAAGIAAASLASLWAASLVAGFSARGWALSFFATVEASDLRNVLLKSALSGYLVAVTCFHLAMGPKKSGRDVGEAVNASIVLGMAVVLLVHSALTLLAYA
ncbi:MAG: ABC transporter permease [Planctomycetota bacterium]